MRHTLGRPKESLPVLPTDLEGRGHVQGKFPPLPIRLGKRKRDGGEHGGRGVGLCSPATLLAEAAGRGGERERETERQRERDRESTMERERALTATWT